MSRRVVTWMGVTMDGFTSGLARGAVGLHYRRV
jgi:hypothetical protein